MYSKLVPVNSAVLEAFLGLLGKPHKNDLQCLVTWDGNVSTIVILDEPPGTRMYVNGEWSIREDVERIGYEVFVISEDLRQSHENGPDLLEIVEATLKSQVNFLWNVRLDEFQWLARLMSAAFDIDLSDITDIE